MVVAFEELGRRAIQNRLRLDGRAPVVASSGASFCAFYVHRLQMYETVNTVRYIHT